MSHFTAPLSNRGTWEKEKAQPEGATFYKGVEKRMKIWQNIHMGKLPIKYR